MRTSEALVAVAFCCLVATPAAAELHPLSDTVAGHPGVTYGALLRQAVPDLKQEGDTWTGSKLAHYRHLLGKDYDNGADGGISLTGVDVRHVHEAGQDRLVLLSFNAAAPNDWFAILAAFDNAKVPKLLDAGNVAADQYNGYYEPSVLKLAGGSDAVLVTSTHSNSNEAYAITSAITLHNGKLLPALTLFTISDHACSHARAQDLSFKAHGSDIVAEVVETSQPLEDDCGDGDPKVKFGKHVYRDTWRWDPRKHRYVGATGVIARLEKITRDRN